MLLIITVGLIFLSTPLWLPSLVTKIRVWLFVAINGEEGIRIPSEEFELSDFRKAYSSKSAGGRSKGANLSNLFWYWLAPGPECHQEHIENGAKYDEVSDCTARILAVPKQEVALKLADSFSREVSSKLKHQSTARLRDQLMPLWADFYFEIVFGKKCTKKAKDLIVGNARDVVEALKHNKLRNMKARLALTDYLEEKIVKGEIKHQLPHSFNSRQKAFYIQGVFFNTAIVQMSEATAHLLMSLAHSPEIQTELGSRLDDKKFLIGFIYESFRRHPLFGVAHRIVTEDIQLDGKKISKGSVLCFDYEKIHQQGEFLPFGMKGNRPCPAQSIVMISLFEFLKLWSKEFTVLSNAEHRRSLANRAPCVLIRKNQSVSSTVKNLLLAKIFLIDQVEKVTRSLQQLIFGTYMVWDASRQKLSDRHFEPTNITSEEKNVVLN